LALPLEVLPAWSAGLRKGLSKKKETFETTTLEALAESALRVADTRLAYVASGAALRTGGTHVGWFMLLRAQSLPTREYQRRSDCLAAAEELGRRQRDMALVARVVDLRREGGFWFGGDDTCPEGPRLDDQMLASVLEYEQKAPERSVSWDDGPGRFRRSRRTVTRRRRQAPLFEDVFESLDVEDDFDDLEDQDALFDEEPDDGPDPVEQPLSPPPPEVLEIILELMREAGGRMPSPKELDRILDRNPKLREKVLELATELGPPPMDMAFPDDIFAMPRSGSSRPSRDERRKERKKARKRRRH
jgi:hypothetical protein